MTDSHTPSPTRQYDTLVSPLESADEPDWMHTAAPEQRRQLQQHQRQGRLARREATAAFAALNSLYHHHRAELTQADPSTIAPQAMLAIHQQSAQSYLADLSLALESSTLRVAKEQAYLATLREEFSIATLKGDLGKQGKQIVEWIIGAFATSSTEFRDQGPYIDNAVVVCSSLQLLGDTVLPDIIVLGPDDDEKPCVAFVPGHPLHPLKQYSNRMSFFTSLRRELLDAAFQAYFRRFMPLQHQQRVLSHWVGRQALLDLPMVAVPLEQGLRSYAHERMVARLLADARYLVPTNAQRAQRLQSIQPHYGRLLAEHLHLGAGSGISAGEENEGRAPSDWIAAFRVVKLEGISRYLRWLPDLSGYRLAAADCPAGTADAQGLYSVGAHKIIAINQCFYRVEHNAAGDWHIAHPYATGVYLPLLRHNGAGSWHHRQEQPQHWGRLSLLRRLGPLTAGFSDARLLELGRVSGTSNTQLRRVYLLDQPVPTLLQYALERARIHDDVARVMGLIAQGMNIPAGYQVPMLDAFHQAVAERNGQAPQSRRITRSNDPAPQPCDTCAPPPLDMWLQWFSRLSRAITTHRFELTQLDTDNSVQELQRRYPNMPLSVAQRMLDHIRDRVLAMAALQAPSIPLPLPIADQARTLDHDSRVTRALEGFTVASSINEDTFVLAVRLLEHFDGWQAGTALLLRRGDRFGEPLAELGETDVETTSVYLDDEEGWSTSTATQVVLAQDMTEFGFYRALLYALSERQRALLGFGLNEPERLHQRLREMALARPSRARLLLGLPVQRSWLTLDSQVQQTGPTPEPAEDNLFEREPVQTRLQRLLTHQRLLFPDSTVERYIYLLLQRNEPVTQRAAELEQERRQLDTALVSWISQGTDATVRGLRRDTADQLIHAWEGHLAQSQQGLFFDNYLIGALPPLPVPLRAVNSLRIMDNRMIGNLSVLLENLPNLQRLELINLPLTELPASLQNLRLLRLLNLSRTSILPPALAPLSALPNLQTLILNDLNVPPFDWTERDMTRLTAAGTLQALTLQSSAATFGAGVFGVLARLPDLIVLNLSENRIRLSDQDVIDFGRLQQLRSLDLSHNPLSRMPDLSNLQNLEEVDLSHLRDTVAHWPEGLERLPMIHSADLRYMTITSVPEGAGRTRGLRMSSADLPQPMQARFNAEMIAAGNVDSDYLSDDDYASEDSSEHEGPSQRDRNALRDAPRLFEGMSAEDRAQAEQLLSTEESSLAEFFSLLLRIDVSRQAQRPEAQMRQRIQALIRGAFNTDLRQALHEQARQAISCVDRDTVVFSQMENLLHADLALAKASDTAAASELIALATSHWRMHRLKEHVTAHITSWRQAGHSIDYSEIELYFRIALATRLGLRDQPAIQVFTSYTRWVTQAMLDSAYAEVLAPQAELLPNYLHEQPYWQRYLDFGQAARVESINQWRDHIGEYLDAVSSGDELPPPLTDTEQQHLREVLIASGQLGALEPLPALLTLNSSQYHAAYDALAKRVDQARMALTRALMEPRPGPSSRP